MKFSEIKVGTKFRFVSLEVVYIRIEDANGVNVLDTEDWIAFKVNDIGQEVVKCNNLDD